MARRWCWHGLLDCGVGWKHLAGVMDRPCYAFDLPGFGESDRPTRNRISAYAEDVQAALAVLEVHDFTVGRWPPVARMTRVRTGSLAGAVELAGEAGFEW
jgi:hypothetical protein